MTFCPTAMKLAQPKTNVHENKHLLEDLREGCLVDFDELLELVEVVAEEAETFVEGDIVR